MILNIRGTHGSGKSWVVHQLLKEPNEAIDDYGYYIPKWDCGVVGRYNTPCGGCDGIKSADEVVKRVRAFYGMFRHVVFEGILVSHTFKRYSDLADELPGFWFLFLDTPLATCISRVKARREEKGNDKLLDPTNVIKDWHTVWEKVQEKCRSYHHNVKILNWMDPMPQILQMLEQL
jgi:hypothetical protein